jgi:hypothetical protein
MVYRREFTVIMYEDNGTPIAEKLIYTCVVKVTMD